jgi:hypothetical protein
MPRRGKRAGETEWRAWVFRDTRLPVTAAFENLEAGATVDQITEWFDIEGSGDRSA